MNKVKQICFVTGNAKKLEEVKQFLNSNRKIELYYEKIDLPELQGEPEYVAREKCRLAFEKVKSPVLIEDTSLCFNALNGLPGVYIKWFLEKTGHEGLNNLLTAYSDKTAYAQCIFCFGESDGKGGCTVRTFVGRCEGKIVLPRGPKEFGWDPVFETSEEPFSGKTFAELTTAEKNKISHRSRALTKFSEFLLTDSN